MKDERILFDLNKELCILMGWELEKERVVTFEGGIVRYIHTHCEGISPTNPYGPPDLRFPDYINNKNDLFSLIMQFHPSITFGEGCVSSFIEGQPEGVTCFFDDWWNKETATAIAVIQSVIKKLKGEQKVKPYGWAWVLVKEFYDGVDCSTQAIAAFNNEEKAEAESTKLTKEEPTNSVHTYYVTKVRLY